MSEANIVITAQAVIGELHRTLTELKRQLEAARSIAETLEDEIHACPNHAHHRAWWKRNEDDL